MPPSWDYLILTASHAPQAHAYESQLAARRQLPLLAGVREVLVVPDLEGRRIGSGGSTLECLRQVLNRERAAHPGWPAAQLLGGLRALIVHAGGDSRRLPAYSACGKIFVPVPGENESALPLTLFDLLVPAFLRLPAAQDGAGQIVVAAGDALLQFDPAAVCFEAPGMTMLASPAAPEEAARHGVFCTAASGDVRLYLQKPSLREQATTGALDSTGRSLLDVGVTNLDARAADALLAVFEVAPAGSGEFEWSAAMRAMLLEHGIDLYREICCAMGSEATLEHYRRAARAAGSRWDDIAFARLFPALRAIPFHAQALEGCRFLHFGATRQLHPSGAALAAAPDTALLALNNQVVGDGAITGAGWVEGCRISAPLRLAGRNVLIGADIDVPVALPAGAALDIVATSEGNFVRCYAVDDSFKDATYCGMPLDDWLRAMNASPADVWDHHLPAASRTLWNARVFPLDLVGQAVSPARWLWMYTPASATEAEKTAWRGAIRRSAAEIAVLADQDAFQRRRAAIRLATLRESC